MTVAKFIRRDHSNDAGLVAYSMRTGACAYLSDAQGLDSSGGAKYTVVCAHNRLVTTGSKRDARFIAGSAANLSELCPACKKGDFNERDLTLEEESL